MHRILRNSAIAAALLAGAALVSAPAMAGSIHDDGDFGGSWNRIGPSHHYRHHYSDRYDYGPRFSYYSSPGYSYYTAPSYYYAPAPSYYYAPYGHGNYGPGAGFSIGIF